MSTTNLRNFALNIQFGEKDKLKELARNNGTRILWDASLKRWYWRGEKLPDFLESYFYNPGAAEAAPGEKTRYYYLVFSEVFPRTYYRVQVGPETDRAKFSVKAKLFLKHYKEDFPGDTNGAIFRKCLDGMFAASCYMRVHEGKCLLPAVHTPTLTPLVDFLQAEVQAEEGI
jgi:hypothetical protein